MSAYGHGRHEHGQNFLTNHKIINSIIDLVKQTSGPIIEIGPGSGALTHPMAHLGRAITAVEVDAKLAAKITQETSSAAVEGADHPRIACRFIRPQRLRQETLRCRDVAFW